MTPRSVKVIHALQSALLLCGIIVAWELVVRVFNIAPLVFPGPTAISVRFVDLIVSGEIWPHFAATLTSILTGFLAGALAGIICGAFIATVPVLDRLVYPYLVALQTMPKIAVAPLFILWFGYGLASKIIITALLCFFPILVSVIAGFRSIDPGQLEMMRVFGATPMQILYRLRIPSALVIIFAGFEIAAVLAVIGAVVGEFVGAQVGLGYLITALNFNMDVPGMFAVLIFLAMIGLTLHGIVRFAKARLVFWVRSEPEKIIG